MNLTFSKTCLFLLWTILVFVGGISESRAQSGSTKFKALVKRFKNPTERKNLYAGLVAFRQIHPGTKESYRAAIFLQQCPSPFDKLRINDPALLNRFQNRPKELVAVLSKHNRAASSVAISPNGKILATSGWDNALHLWRLDAKEFKHWSSEEGSPSGLAFSPDGKQLASGSTGAGVTLWDVAANNPKPHKTISGHDSRPFALAYSPNGNFFASGNAGPMMRVWMQFENDWTAWAAFSGKGAASVSVQSISFSADSKLVAIGSLAGKRPLRLWDVSGSYMKELVFPGKEARLVEFSPDGKTILTGKADGAVLIWEMKNAKFTQKRFIRDHRKIGRGRQAIRAAAFSPTGHRLVTSGENKEVFVWDPSSGKRLRQWVFPQRANALAFAPDGRHFATANNDGTVFVLRLDGPP